MCAPLCVCMCMCTHMCVYVWLCTLVFVCVYVILVCANVYVHLCICVLCTLMCMCICMYMYTRVYVCMHVHSWLYVCAFMCVCDGRVWVMVCMWRSQENLKKSIISFHLKSAGGWINMSGSHSKHPWPSEPSCWPSLLMNMQLHRQRMFYAAAKPLWCLEREAPHIFFSVKYLVYISIRASLLSHGEHIRNNGDATNCLHHSEWPAMPLLSGGPCA